MAEDERPRYRLLTGPDTSEFCSRISDALAEGYVLYGSPAMTFDGTNTYVAQAVVLPEVLAAAASAGGGSGDS